LGFQDARSPTTRLEFVLGKQLVVAMLNFVTMMLLAQGILARGAELVILFAIGVLLFGYVLARFRATIGTMV
jgi:hypothetical protein